MTLDQISLINPSNKLQRKLEFFGIEDKNPKQTQDRIEYALDTIKTRFGPMNGRSNPDASKFCELMAIEASFGEPIIHQDGQKKNDSLWNNFYEHISRKKKFVKFKDCINEALEQKENEAKEQELKLLQALYARKKKPMEGDENDAET